MNDELAARHRAITLRLAGRPVKAIGTAGGRSEVWFRRWWGLYLQAGTEGLYDLRRDNPRRPAHTARAGAGYPLRPWAPGPRDAGQPLLSDRCPAILAELTGHCVRPLPCVRTIERVLERNNLTAP